MEGGIKLAGLVVANSLDSCSLFSPFVAEHGSDFGGNFCRAFSVCLLVVEL